MGRDSIRLRFFATLAIACALLGFGATAATASTTHDLRGAWSCCSPGSGGVATQTWTITSMDKSSGAFSGTGKGGSYTFPIKGTANGNSVTLTTGPYDQLKSYSATFKGTLSADSKKLSGDWDDDPTPEPSGTFTATRPSAPKPGGPADPPDTGDDKGKAVAGDLFVSDSSANSGSGAVYRVDAETGSTTLIHLGPPFSAIRDIAFGPDGHLYVTDIGASAVHEINLKTGAVTRLTKQFDPLLRNPWGIAYDPLLGDFLVTDFFFGSVVRVDPKTGATKQLVKDDVLKRAHSIALAPGGAAFVSGFKERGVVKVERAGDAWKATTFKKGPFVALLGIAIGTTPAGSRFFVTDSVPYTQAGGVYSWLGGAKPESIASNSVIGTPAGLGLSSDGKTLYIGSTGTSAGSGSVIAMNLANDKLRTLAGGFVSPESIAVGLPKRPAVNVSASGPGTGATPNGVTTAVTSPAQPVLAAVAVSVSVPSFRPAAQASRAVRVKAVSKAIPPGKRTKVRVRFKRSLTKQIRAALKAGKKVRAKITVTATAANGSSRKALKRTRIKLGR